MLEPIQEHKYLITERDDIHTTTLLLHTVYLSPGELSMLNYLVFIIFDFVKVRCQMLIVILERMKKSILKSFWSRMGNAVCQVGPVSATFPPTLKALTQKLQVYHNASLSSTAFETSAGPFLGKRSTTASPTIHSCSLIHSFSCSFIFWASACV